MNEPHLQHAHHQHHSHVAPEGREPGGMVYTCPMHPEIRQNQPGQCPKCGMSLEPVIPAVSAPAGVIYTCPMHPEVRQDHPGNCPICGMTLEPVLPAAEDEENTELKDFTLRFGRTLPFSGLC